MHSPADLDEHFGTPASESKCYSVGGGTAGVAPPTGHDRLAADRYGVGSVTVWPRMSELPKVAGHDPRTLGAGTDPPVSTD
jgi:hypothetical protein